MIVKLKKFEKTRHVKNIHKSKKIYVLRGDRNVRYHDRFLSNKKKSNDSTLFHSFTNSSVQKGV